MLKNWIQRKTKSNTIKIDEQVVLSAAIEYRKDGKVLMGQLAEKFNLDIENPKDFEKLIFRGNNDIPRRGELSSSWNYVFHGTECGFHNKHNKQSVEVVLSSHPNFGHIDSWFLLSYMKTSKKYRSEMDGITWQELKGVIERLYAKGELEEVMR